MMTHQNYVSALKRNCNIMHRKSPFMAFNGTFLRENVTAALKSFQLGYNCTLFLPPVSPKYPTSSQVAMINTIGLKSECFTNPLYSIR